jgi:uncharacterized membrane protein
MYHLFVMVQVHLLDHNICTSCCSHAHFVDMRAVTVHVSMCSAVSAVCTCYIIHICAPEYVQYTHTAAVSTLSLFLICCNHCCCCVCVGVVVEVVVVVEEAVDVSIHLVTETEILTPSTTLLLLVVKTTLMLKQHHYYQLASDYYYHQFAPLAAATTTTT